MIRGILAAAAFAGVVISTGASARSLDKSLELLTPEFRSHQACIIRGLNDVRRNPKLRKADRMKTSIESPAVLEGTKLTAKGGAVRAAGKWYAMSFSCNLTKNWMKATSFTYVLGKPIPEREWENLGLWR